MSVKPGKILVVDDNEMNRDMLSRRLARRGFEVMTANDGQQALDADPGNERHQQLLKEVFDKIDM